MDWPQALTVFVVFAFILAGAFEMRQPLSAQTLPYLRRWSLHFALWISFAFLLPLVFRVSALTLAESLNGNLSFLPFLILYDLSLWLTHLAFHKFRFLWIWHSVHHSDPDMDASTGFRFHPLEVIADRGVILALIYLVQPALSSLIAVQFFSIASNFWVHSNIAIPARLESLLGKVFMTPGLHRTHHATEIESQNANFGIIFSFWDRLFALRRTGPIAPPVGLDGIPASSTASPLFVLLQLPWREWKATTPTHTQSKAAPPLAIHT